MEYGECVPTCVTIGQLTTKPPSPYTCSVKVCPHFNDLSLGSCISVRNNQGDVPEVLRMVSDFDTIGHEHR